MAESSVCSTSMGRSEVVSLRETLRTQQKLLQKLYIELEEEREASATAASEALSMILRLQEEKAAEKMEATQYKRMMEEKMHHVERSLLFVKELMYQKEMEIASLEFQVQAYRYKMLSMGFSDLVIAEMRFGEHRFMQQNEARYGDLDLDVHLGSVRRNKSLPATPFNSCSDKATIEIDGSLISLADLLPKKIDEESHREVEEVQTEEINTYWNQIKQLDERIEDLSHNHGHLSNIAVYSESLESKSRSCSVESLVNRDFFGEPTIGPRGTNNSDPEGTTSCSCLHTEDPTNKLEFDASSVMCWETETQKASDSIGVYDVFEVPQSHEICEILKSETKEENKLILKGETEADSVSKGASDCHFKDEVEPVNKGILYPHPKKKISKPRDVITIDCGLAVRDPQVGLAQSQAEVQQLNKQMEQLEDQRSLFNQDVFDRREEELKLLKEINEKLNMLQSELRSLKSKTCPPRPRDEPSPVSLIEAFLSFSI